MRLPLTALFLLAACGNQSSTSNPADDLGPSRDMTLRPPLDLTSGPPMLTVPTGCSPATVTAAQIYDPLFKPNCSNNNCHGGPQVPSLKSAADLLALVGQGSTSSFAFVDAGGDINKSYLLYKLADEQQRVPRGGGQPMPPTGNLFDDTSLCRVINWVRSGAR